MNVGLTEGEDKIVGFGVVHGVGEADSWCKGSEEGGKRRNGFENNVEGAGGRGERDWCEGQAMEMEQGW